MILSNLISAPAMNVPGLADIATIPLILSSVFKWLNIIRNSFIIACDNVLTLIKFLKIEIWIEGKILL